MSSAWGESFALAWGDSWGSVQVVPLGRFPRSKSSPTYRSIVTSQARSVEQVNERLQEVFKRADVQADSRAEEKAQARPIDQSNERLPPEPNKRH